jgi:Fuc2NAc and GlcNAc transferase
MILRSVSLMISVNLFILVFSSVVSWLTLRALMPLLRLRLLDQPNDRSSHVSPTPRGGGVVFVLMSVISGLFAFIQLAYFPGTTFQSDLLLVSCVPLASFPLAIFGFVDDRFDLPVISRLAVQILTSTLVVLMCHLPLALVPMFVLVLGITAVINFTNFMDGLDGLVAGTMVIAISTLALRLSAPWSLWVLIGALLGFLVWNWSPAKVFMGDVGSTFLGAVFAGLVIQSSSWAEAFGFLLVATPLLGDAFFCVLRRFLAGQRVLEAHRLHLYQRLHQAGWPHSSVSLTYIVATAVIAIAVLLGALPLVIVLAALEIMIGFWLDQQVAVPFSVASRS